jgi:putative transposase
MKYQFIEQHKHEFPIVVMCQALAVSESGFYAWRKRPTCQRQREDAQSRQEIRQVFSIHQGRYGSLRIQKELHDQGREISRKRVARLMCEADLNARRKRRRVVTTKRDMTQPVAPNILNREFTAKEPNKKWVTDMTYIPTKQGWLYLAVILDLYSHMVVGWTMPGNCEEELIEHALICLEQSKIIASMSRKANCCDKSVTERFFGTLKDE